MDAEAVKVKSITHSRTYALAHSLTHSNAHSFTLTLTHSNVHTYVAIVFISFRQRRIFQHAQGPSLWQAKGFRICKGMFVTLFVCVSACKCVCVLVFCTCFLSVVFPFPRRGSGFGRLRTGVQGHLRPSKALGRCSTII